MELDCWSEDWGLPSIDTECLKVLAFAKFSGAPLVANGTNNPFWTPKGDLPVLRHNGVQLTHFSSISEHLKCCNYSADYNLTPKQLSEANAFIQLMDEKLFPALKYIMWIDTKNHLELTRVWFGKHLPFPLGLYYPSKFEKIAVKLIESLYAQHSEFGEIGNDTIVETSVYKSAQECLTLLSNRLGENDYMFGRSPSGVDAVMYGYLAPLLKAPLPNSALQNYLKECKNLASFVVRISQNYFPQVVKAYEARRESEGKKKEEEAKQRSGKGRGGGGGDNERQGGEEEEEDEPWPNERRNKIIAGAVATTAMFGYAYASGLVDVVRNIEIRFEEEEEEDVVEGDMYDNEERSGDREEGGDGRRT